jgi:hypothetical protein
LSKARWFPDEPICKNKQYHELPWVKKQRQVRRLLRNQSDTGFFTVRKLNAVSVAPGLRGIDPDDASSASRSGPSGRKQRRRIRNLMLIAIEFEGSSTAIFQQVRQAVSDFKSKTTQVKAVRRFGEQVSKGAAKSSSKPSKARARKASTSQTRGKPPSNRKVKKGRKPTAKAPQGVQGRLKIE